VATAPRDSKKLERNFAAVVRAHPQWPRIVSEGDSWFSFPFAERGNLIDFLERELKRAALLRLERSGDSLETMLSPRAKSRLGYRLGHWRVDLLLFSGGGNDFVGARGFAALLAPGAGLDDAAVEARLDRIEARYLELAALRDAFRRECTIVAHGYDYPIPADRGVRQLGLRLTRPWMHPALVARGIVEPVAQRAIARELIDRFHARLQAVAARCARFVAVDLRGTLGPGDWGDEIHPTRAGFAKLGRRLVRAVRDVVPGAFR
jgi:hypothetical protein